jgi:hypothetical protein
MPLKRNLTVFDVDGVKVAGSAGVNSAVSE